jgi:hypothetical protein
VEAGPWLEVKTKIMSSLELGCIVSCPVNTADVSKPGLTS